MANSRIGAEQFTIAKLLSDPVGGTATYDTPYAFTKKLIKVDVKHSGSMEPQYSDDQTTDMYVELGDITINIESTDLTEDEKALINGETMVAGVRSPDPSDVKPYFCVMWKSKKRNGKYKYYKVLKVMFAEADESFETKKEKNTPQTDTISGTGIQRISDGLRKRIADADSATYVAGTGSAWFTTGDITPDTTPPTLTVVPADAATGQLATVNVAWTFDEAIQPVYATGANFTLTKADGTAVAGAVTISTDNTVVTFNPTASLDASGVYIAFASSNVKDMSGNAMAANSVTNFTVSA